MRQRILIMAASMISRLAPHAESEALVGDLLEEYALRAAADSHSVALRWYLRQILMSGLNLLWTRITQTAWISTFAVALLAYTSVGVAEFAIRRSLPNSPVTTMIATFPAVVGIAYLAGGLRRRAPVVLATLMLLAVTLMTLTANENLSLGYQIAYFLVGPSAVLLGGGLRLAANRKSN